ncbi:N-acetylmuramic acid 6-phosphate etherase [uncultured Proteiniphilum sp.]|uniref:N-acetylmuramic acid 6-phosphate etherase n=1 Tax=uncultured Proteiniphilum sp. TaxID=497637 RepID=UPI00260CC670|nr:N-acetylmuramic acid 6-phosphate etherase [uncultured Proteiniphilum sp.]
MDSQIYLGIDIGGSRIKAVTVLGTQLRPVDVSSQIDSAVFEVVDSRLRDKGTIDDFITALDELLDKIFPKDKTIISGIGISTAGIVNYAGTSVEIAGGHISALTDSKWINHLKEKTKAPVALINDADATAVGAAVKGYLSGIQTIGVMPIGTGVGFTVWRNGRLWRPGGKYTLLGSIMSPKGSFDEIAGLAEINRRTNGRLSELFKEEFFIELRTEYEQHLSEVIYSACVVYNIDKILIGGGLAEIIGDYPLKEVLEAKIEPKLATLAQKVDIEIMYEGNRLPLIGASMLAIGEQIARKNSRTKRYEQIETEIPYQKSIHLEKKSAISIVELLDLTERESAEKLKKSIPSIAEVANLIADRLKKGGRLLYVGAGTSGRLAAIDTVEIPCTFGFPRDKVMTFISGGIADASIEIETNFEEDASAVPELLLVNVQHNDIVIGISVSGSAYYVQSALAFAKYCGAFSVLISESDKGNTFFCDRVIALHSGHELVAGSTRMKAGTATKKVLNYLSTTAMILLGNVYDCYMVEVECINQKLIKRAQNLMQILFGIKEEDTYKILEQHDFNLKKAIIEMTISSNGE